MESTIEGYQLSATQDRILDLTADAARYSRAVWRIEGPLDVERLRAAAQHVAGRHEILSSTFPRLPGMRRPMQSPGVLHPSFFAFADLSGEQAPRTQALLEHDARSVDALATGPCFRVRVLRLAAERYLLASTAHVLCADAASHRIFFGELSDAYLHRPLEERPFAYAQFSQWQRAMAEEEPAAEAKVFWRERRLASACRPLPFCRSGGTNPFARRVLNIDLPRGFVDRVAARAVGAADLFFGAAAALLARIQGEDRISLGWVDSGRSAGVLRNAVGPYAQLFALPINMSEKITGQELLGSVRRERETASLFGQEFLRALEPDQPAGSSPHLAVEEVSTERENQLRATLEECASYGDPVALQLVCVSTPGAIRSSFHHDASRIDGPDVARFADQLISLAEGILEDLTRPVLEVPIREREPAPDLSLEAIAEAPPAAIHELIEAQCRRAPEAPAVTSEGEAISYSTLDARAEQLAERLRSLGVRAEDRVCLCVEPSIGLIVAVYGTLKSGAAYVALNTEHPPARLARMIADSGARVVIAGRAQVEVLRGVAARLVVIEEPGGPAESDGAAPQRARVDPAQSAYVVYTSGTTGKPKGVAVEHRQLVNYVRSILARFDCPAGATHALVASIAADLGNTSIYAALCSGGNLHVLPRDRIRDGRAIEKYFLDHPIDYLKTTPSHFEAITSVAESGAVFPRKALILGGEGARRAWIDGLRAAAPSCEIYNHYGPSETTVGVLTWKYTDRAPPAQTMPLERRVSGTGIYLLDERLAPVPTWHPGQVYIAGAPLARGYLGQPGATAAAFVPDPFGPSGARMYRTGDRARRWPSGELELLGRDDQQISLRGFRIELAEIEAALEEHPLVEKAIAELRTNPQSVPFLAAHVLPKCGPDRIVEDLPTYDLPNGLTIAHGNRSETEFLYEEIFERQTYFQHGIRLPPRACVLDVGANIGMFTLQAATLSEGCRVYSFEPIRRVFEILARNTKLHAPNAKVFNAGVSDREREETFFCYPRHTMMSGVGAYADPEMEERVVRTFMHNAERNGSQRMGRLLENIDELLEGRFEAVPELCRLTTISNVIRAEGIEHIDLLKVDVQRAELDVLRGIEDADWDKIDQIALELHDAEGGATAGRAELIRGILEARGFRVAIEQDPMLAATDRYSLYAITTRRDRRPAPDRLPEKFHPPSLLSAGSLRKHAARLLPDYMVPVELCFLEAMPRTASGKIDRSALAARPLEISRRDAFVAPRTPTEHAVAVIWSDVLGGKQVGVNDNFFELGGHSLLVMLVLSRIRDTLGVEIPVRSFFESPTIAELAERLEAAIASGRATERVELVRSGRPIQELLEELDGARSSAR